MANIYATDDVTERKPLTVAPISAVLEVGNCGERWCEVTLPCGTKAWVQEGDGEIVDAAAPRMKLSPERTRDLIFFSKAKDKITHVGMMISGQAIDQGARRPKE